MEALAYNPTESQPLGQSRITRAVRFITDSGVREALRTEISAEFFTSPQKYLLGVDSDPFANKTRWEAYIGNIFTVSQTEDGTTPKFGQLSQGSMQPHTDYMRALAARFSGETNVPVSQLGVIHDNPSSAEAITQANEPLIMEVTDLNEGNGEALVSIAKMALAIANDATLDTYDALQIAANFREPAHAVHRLPGRRNGQDRVRRAGVRRHRGLLGAAGLRRGHAAEGRAADGLERQPARHPLAHGRRFLHSQSGGGVNGRHHPARCGGLPHR